MDNFTETESFMSQQDSRNNLRVRQVLNLSGSHHLSVRQVENLSYPFRGETPMNQNENPQVDDQAVTEKLTEISDLEVSDDVKGGTKMPSPTTPIIGPKPTPK